MGNLIHVTEPAPEGGTHETSYAYNLLNQMTTVTMPRNTTPQGLVTQTRTFNYDLTTGRLTSATNPENGTVSYTYNTDGTLSQKTDAKNQKIQYTYDTYGRVTEKRAYQGSTEDLNNRVDYTYNTLGQLASAQWGQTTGTVGQFLESYGYGAGGLVTSKTLQLTSQGGGPGSQTVNFSYNTDGTLSGISLPSIWARSTCVGNYCYAQQTGPNYVYSFDTLGRHTQLNETVSGSVMANNVSYGGPSGQLSALTWTIPPIPLNQDSGIQFNETRLYNPRGQMTRLKYSAVLSGEPLPNVDQTYTFSSTANDGRITQMTDAISGEVVQYQYDSLGRLTLAQTTGTQWGQSFGYDGFGNLTSEVATKGTAFTSYQNYDATTNRIVGGGTSYDANGNLTAMPTLTLSYDEENRLVQSVQSLNGSEQYVYNPSGQLVYREAPTWQGPAAELYIYGPQGQRMRFGVVWPSWSDMNVVLLLYEDQELHFAGKLLETNDRLGTSVVTASGWTAKTYPYGELREALPSNAGARYATYLLDSTTNLNYARNRWYSSQVARFTTVDPSGSASPGSPQSWNQYAYVMGDPVNHYDPAGTFSCGPGDPCPAELCWDEYGGEYIGWFTTCLGEGATNSMGRPGEVKPTPQQRKLEWWKKTLHAAVKEAMTLLNNKNKPDCAGLFGLGNDFVFTHVFGGDPAAFLSGLETNGNIVANATQPNGKRFPGPDVGASTTPLGGPAFTWLGTPVSSPMITINPNGFFASGKLNGVAVQNIQGSGFQGLTSVEQVEAAVILHELGHATGVFGPDIGPGVPSNASATNTATVVKDCF